MIVDQLIFPGFKVAKVDDETPPRLVVETSIMIKDTYTGEVVRFKMPGETDVPSEVNDIVLNAIRHKKTEKNIRCFCEGRKGDNHDIERKENREDEEEVVRHGNKERGEEGHQGL